MISLLNGTLRAINSDRVVIEVQGVGYAVLVTSATSASLTLGATAILHTSLVVREDSLTLFGFLDEESKNTFELLQTVSGVGPKVALSILGSLSIEDLARAIAQENVGAIEKVPGIGKKGAQRMILELKGKMTRVGGHANLVSHQPPWREQLTSALVSLGFTPKDSDNAISALVSRLQNEGVDPADVALGDLLKDALANGKGSRA
jgi:Holliday junction DNA helicase RuvA